MKKNKSTFDDVARLVSPPDCGQFFEAWGAVIAQNIVAEGQFPNRRPFYNELLVIAELANRLINFLDNTPWMVMLESESNTKIRYIVSLQAQLKELAAAVSKAAKSPGITNAEGKVKRGRGKFRPEIFITIKEFCALVISEAWLHAHGHLPAPNSRPAADAARALLLACDGKSGWGTDPRTGWAESFKQVRSERYSSRRCCSLASRVALSSPLLNSSIAARCAAASARASSTDGSEILGKVLREERPDLFRAHLLIVDQLGQRYVEQVSFDFELSLGQHRTDIENWRPETVVQFWSSAP